MASHERFGYQWNKYPEIVATHEVQFRQWIGPLSPADFQDKEVLDAGCGMGRNSFWPLRYGARRVVAFDMDERSLAAARYNLKDFPQAQVLVASIYDITWKDEFDIVFSIGVIHHLRDPHRAVANLVRATKPGGTIIVWVYSFEGNEWIVRLVSPIRRNITSRLPVSFTHVLSYFLSVPLFLFVKLRNGPTPYLRQLAQSTFSQLHLIVFDQLIPEVAEYWTKNEAASLFSGLSVKDVQVIRPTNQMGWTATAKKV